MEAGIGRRGRNFDFRVGWPLGQGFQCQVEAESTARTWLALHADIAAHQGDEFPAERQAQPRAAMIAGRTAVGLHETLEQLGLQGGINADARVADLEGEMYLAVRRRQAHDPQGHLAARGEFDGVVEQIR